jgi:protein FrlC
MKIGTATSVLYQYSIQDAIRIVASAGYDGIDIWGGRPHVYRQDLTENELIDLRKLIHDHGLVVSSFMPAFYRYPHSLSNPNPKIRKDSISYMKICIDNASILGTGIVLVVPDNSIFGQKKEDSLNRMMDSIDEVARYASPHDLKLGLEVLYHDETDLINNSDDALAIIHKLGYENLGVVIDTGTLNLSKETPEEIVNKLKGLLLQVHVNDNDGDEKQQNLIPGDGSYNFKHLIRILNENDYSGFLSAELSKEYSSDPATALRTTAKRLRTWID